MNGSYDAITPYKSKYPADRLGYACETRKDKGGHMMMVMDDMSE